MIRRSPSSDRHRRSIRADIEGLRAISVLAVIVYHVFPELLPGGFMSIEIFFVISGFLITTNLTNEHLRTGTISLRMFYARRALRLIPAATATLVGTAVAIALFVPRAFWSQFGGDVIAAAFYIVNWTLAAQSVDYLAEDNAPSPVQHFWTLAVEEQYYLLWPVLMLGVGLIATAAHVPKRWAFAAMGAVVTVVSAGWAIYQYDLQNTAAYFVTTTRLWELAVGSVVAIAYPRLQRTAWGKQGAGLLGLGGIFAAMWIVQGALQWPSPWTFLPILATALVLAAGGGASRTIAERVLGIAPLVWVGGLSYSLYLWHWPVAVIAEEVFGKPGVLQGVAILVVSIALAWLTRVSLEDPLRFHPGLRARPRNGLLVGVIGAIVSALAGLAIWLGGSVSSVEKATQAPGAAVLSTPITATPAEKLAWRGGAMLPVPTEAFDDVPSLYGDDCQPPEHSPELRICVYGDVNADRTIAMVGDSKIMQWQPAIERIAQLRHYKLILMTKNACAFADAPAIINGTTTYPACDRWRGPAFAALRKYKPEVVFTGHGSFLRTPSSKERLVDGLESMYSRLRAAGFPTVVVGDNRAPGQVIPVCLQTNATDPSKCTFTMEAMGQTGGFPLQSRAISRLGGTRVNADGEVTPGRDKDLVFVDMTDAICPPHLEACPPVIGNVLIYRQGTHITATYVTTLTKRFSHALDEARVFD